MMPFKIQFWMFFTFFFVFKNARNTCDVLKKNNNKTIFYSTSIHPPTNSNLYHKIIALTANIVLRLYDN